MPVRCRRGGGLEGKFEISWRQGPLKRVRGPLLSRLRHKPKRALREKFEARLGAHGPSHASEIEFLASRDCHARPSHFEHLGWYHVHVHRAQFEYPDTLIYISGLYLIIVMILGGQDLCIGRSSKLLHLWKSRVARIFHFLHQQQLSVRPQNFAHVFLRCERRRVHFYRDSEGRNVQGEKDFDESRTTGSLRTTGPSIVLLIVIAWSWSWFGSERACQPAGGVPRKSDPSASSRLPKTWRVRSSFSGGHTINDI